MRRAEFLKVLGAGTLAALAGSALSACKNSTTPSDPTASKVFTSQATQGHNHTITIAKTEVESPPTGGISRETSANGHTHTFTMTAAELATVRGRTPVDVVTGNTSGHNHIFTISRWY
jgi:hypothetical protein